MWKLFSGFNQLTSSLSNMLFEVLLKVADQSLNTHNCSCNRVYFKDYHGIAF